MWSVGVSRNVSGSWREMLKEASAVKGGVDVGQGSGEHDGLPRVPDGEPRGALRDEGNEVVGCGKRRGGGSVGRGRATRRLRVVGKASWRTALWNAAVRSTNTHAMERWWLTSARAEVAASVSQRPRKELEELGREKIFSASFARLQLGESLASLRAGREE